MRFDPTPLYRLAAILFALVAAITATVLLAEAAVEDGLDVWDVVRAFLIFVTTAWLSWGAAMALLGLAPRPKSFGKAERALYRPGDSCVVLVPICNEDPVQTFARIAVMDASMRAAGVVSDIAVLSDTRDEDNFRAERAAFARLLQETDGAGRIYYRRRQDNRGRKAGNIEDFIRNSGGAYEFAVILDADSLMEGQTIRQMIARMQADPNMGLLQTLPKITGSTSLFGRAQQFAASFFSPVFSRGLARMQGKTGPFWGHNAIIRVKAFAESCALPPLAGKPPFGGHILSHDYVEAALLARAGWTVQVDETIEGSFEEGPDNILAFAKRDRRWCQGNLQHIRLLTAPGLRAWSRFVFVQGIFAYIVSLIWGLFLIASVIATIMAPLPDYFPDPYQLFPVFPSDRTQQIIALGIGIFGLLVVPKLAILGISAASGRARGYGGAGKLAASVVIELLLSSMMAPVMLMYQSKAVLQVLSGRDGGWPANQRGEGRLSLAEGFAATAWIQVFGAAALALVWYIAPELLIWMLPVGVPMLLAPWIISLSSQPIGRGLFVSPEETAPSEVVLAYRALLARWTGTDTTEPADTSTGLQNGAAPA
ncbi:glucans biosynthesis glucosyltransferase MdoH [Pseudooceanicola sp. CBS1P-1]|uniref:Glucans biosynthesis glucosyltransferase H n=1 Tax=Pseudooceanicola albus TaxID=2692189 RepID=A0A6L7G3H9_9RHOB|nr:MULTISPECIES: glucans biosynthesis glucosyltransferase MdoH [Pseudooceanicola]MBT9384948.1 glucans biosynthesis glucosyltransferase MdoH [Pseudooceanicola endophyticus]MXN18057.1 glucans biosynthesis glucosyltransferase MdoH [Pseudooceanicola albus]